MWSPKFFLLLTVVSTTSASLRPHHRLAARQFVTENNVADSYDFVIAGGGTAGLSLATRLSANSNFTVLVIEAGEVGPDSVDTPAFSYFKSLTGTEYDWSFRTAAQSSAGGRNVPWPRGKLLGGSSAINGMYLIRPHEIEVNAWHDMISSQPDADQWTWDRLFAAMKKSEVFTPPTDDVAKTAGIQYNADSHGTTGPVHHSYPGYMVPVSQNWLPTLEAAGIATTVDPYAGRTVGGFFACSAINPSNWTRSYAKPAYLDPLPPRSNLHVLVGNTVTQIVFDDSSSSSSEGLKATAVEFASGPSDTPKTVKVNKEVIVSGGSVNSPQILQLSGVGSSDVLKNAGVDVKLDLPGVGTHLQDHYVGVFFKSSEPTQGDIYNSGSDLSVRIPPLVGSSDSQVLDGYKAIYSATADKIFTSETALVEILFSINAPGQIAVQAGIQHAFSQGRVYISSKSAFDAPVIDPQYFSHWADVITMREGLKLARKIAQTAPLSTILGDEVSPGSNVQTDSDWDNWLTNNGGTEFHPTSSCAMLPKEQGGVVDNKLKVYGLANVRVVDASVFPINFAAHTMAPVYGLVEIAAEIIQNDYAPPSVNSSDSSDRGSSGSSGDQHNGGIAVAFDSQSLTLSLGGLVSMVLVALNAF
ncbi:Oxygen-dependent choline dehydrogenase [Leucoagaricus sp. SymC.cos]|nr:Oxygen-dependent choline dehydrogenase [Leucoagaricus sp. SymC.cos]